MYFVDKTGKKYGRLTVIKLAYCNNESFWKCKCACGNYFIVRGSALQSGNTKSCGCLQKENGRKQGLASTKHGEASHQKGRTRTYRIWRSMIGRCLFPSATGFKNYGGRGIKVCKRWLDYSNFKKDMGVCPTGLTIDRKNNEKGYYPSNCRWADMHTQARNSRNAWRVVYKGKTKSAKEWSEILNINHSTLCRKLRKGKTIEEILND